MRFLLSKQINEISDPVRSKFAMVVPVIEATLFALNSERIARLGGLAQWTLADLAREYREGSGDAGICLSTPFMTRSHAGTGSSGLSPAKSWNDTAGFLHARQHRPPLAASRQRRLALA